MSKSIYTYKTTKIIHSFIRIFLLFDIRKNTEILKNTKKTNKKNKKNLNLNLN